MPKNTQTFQKVWASGQNEMNNHFWSEDFAVLSLYLFMYLCTLTTSNQVRVNVFILNVAYFFQVMKCRLIFDLLSINLSILNTQRLFLENTTWHSHKLTVIIYRRKSSLEDFMAIMWIYRCQSLLQLLSQVMLQISIWNIWLKNLILSPMDSVSPQ